MSKKEQMEPREMHSQASSALQAKCYRHYTTDATATCAVCGRALCHECIRRDDDLVRCPRCAYEGLQPGDVVVETQVVATKVCPVCGAVNPADATRCQKCEVYFERFEEVAQVECPVCHTLNPYGLTNCQKCGIKLGAVKAKAGGRELVGFGPRLGAYLIDGLVLFIFQLLFSLAAVGSSDPDAATGVQCLSMLIVAAYYIGFWTSRGQTPGKMAMGIKIVKADGSPVTFGTALVRYIGYWISALVLLLGFLWVLWDADKQAWHDKIAGTYVVRV